MVDLEFLKPSQLSYQLTTNRFVTCWDWPVLNNCCSVMMEDVTWLSSSALILEEDWLQQYSLLQLHFQCDPKRACSHRRLCVHTWCAKNPEWKAGFLEVLAIHACECIWKLTVCLDLRRHDLCLRFLKIWNMLLMGWETTWRTYLNKALRDVNVTPT